VLARIEVVVAASESEQLIAKLRIDIRDSSQRKSSEVGSFCYCGTVSTNMLDIWNIKIFIASDMTANNWKLI
jgi:hypothetical protein